MKRAVFRFLGMNPRIATVALHDVAMAALSFELALQLRYVLYGAPQPWGFLWPGTVLFALVCAVVFWRMGLYRGIWHYASLNDLVAILRAVTVAVAVFLPLLFVLNRLDAYPRVALPLNWAILILLLTVPRFLYRAIKDGNLAAAFRRENPDRVPVLLVGAGNAAEAFLREMARSRQSPYRVVGIVDDRPGRIGRELRGIRVLGGIADVADVLAQLVRRGLRPHRMILAGEFSGATVRRLVDIAEAQGLPLGRVPQLTDFRGGDIEVRKVDVEDLLGRPQNVLDRDAMARLVAGRRVLVTGAGGTIGAELCRQVAAFAPAHLTLFDNGEYNLYAIDLDLDAHAAHVPRTALLGDVRDRERLAQCFAAARPDLVFHAAAFKHVPLSEANPVETVLTNVIGTRNVAYACRAAATETMVLISTDKAVHSSSVMGASKRVAELVCQAVNTSGAPTRCVTVRFGNVLGSTGSVIPRFEQQLRAGGPLTVTHADATRYFMTVREAVELVLQASALPSEAADSIYVLDMGDPVRIQDLARQMIRLSGHRPDVDIAIEFTGLRPGEKLHETLFHEAEDLRSSPVPGIRIGQSRGIDYELLAARLDRLEAACRACRTAEVLDTLAELVPEAHLQISADIRAAVNGAG